MIILDFLQSKLIDIKLFQENVTYYKCETTRVENRGEKTRGKLSWWRNFLLLQKMKIPAMANFSQLKLYSKIKWTFNL